MKASDHYLKWDSYRVEEMGGFAAACLCAALLPFAGCTKQTLHNPSSSMEPTLPAGSDFICDYSAYDKKDPDRFDIILMDATKVPKNSGVWARRIIALPGETVDFAGDDILVDGKRPVLPASLAGIAYEGAKIPSRLPSPLTLGPDQYFVLGDNAKNAVDSRMWGALKRSAILGKIVP